MFVLEGCKSVDKILRCLLSGHGSMKKRMSAKWSTFKVYKPIRLLNRVIGSRFVLKNSGIEYQGVGSVRYNVM